MKEKMSKIFLAVSSIVGVYYLSRVITEFVIFGVARVVTPFFCNMLESKYEKED